MNKTTLIAILFISMAAVVQMKTLLVETADDTDGNAKFEHGKVGEYWEESPEDSYGSYSDETDWDTQIRGRRRKSSRKT